MILQIFKGDRVVGIVLINISPSNIFLNMILLEKFNQNCQAGFGYCEHLIGLKTLVALIAS